MAVFTSIQPMKGARVLGGFDFPSESFLEGASVVNKLGAPMVLTSGLLVEASANPDGVVVGLAEQAGNNDAGSLTTDRCILALPNVVFEGALASTTASDPDQAHTLAQTDVGLKFGIAQGTTSKFWYVNFSNTTNTRVVVIGLKDAIGTISGRVYFMFTLNGNGTGHSTIYS